MALDNFSYYLIIIASFILAGVLKGATGAGAPIITIPVISAFYDVRLAVVLMVVPNFLSNIQQLIILENLYCLYSLHFLLLWVEVEVHF